MTTNHVPEIKAALTDVRDLLSKLGLLDGKGSFARQSGGFLVRCPVHHEKTPSCSVQVRQGAVLWNCHGCGEGGDVLDLVAAARGLSAERNFTDVLREAATLGGLWGVVDELGGLGSPRPQKPVHAPPEDRTYPPAAELAAFVGSCCPVTDEPDVAAWLSSRALSPDAVASTEQVLALPLTAPVPRWAAYRGQRWTETGHRLIVLMRDSTGELRSVRACRVTDGDTPKRLPPGGYIASGLVMACPLALGMLRGTFAPKRVVISEGEPDWMSWASRADSSARLGIVSGSWTDEFAARVPDGATVIVRTDNDAAGDRYAAVIIASLSPRCAVRRLQADDADGTDDNDRAKAGKLPADPESGTIPVTRKRLPRMHDAIIAGCKSIFAGVVPNPLQTGFHELDDGLRRLGAKEVTMLAADSGVGKSTLATQIALHAGATGHGVVYLNLEMSPEMYGLRTLANYIRIPVKKARSGELLGEDHQRILEGVKTLQSAATCVAMGDSSEHRTIAGIKTFCAAAAKELESEGTPLALIVVDHVLQVMVNIRNDVNAEGKARADLLKDLADTHNAHVLALVHITREGSKSGSMPSKNQLASSAWFDRHADNILIFHQKRTALGTFSDARATLSCQKARWGEPFAVELEYVGGFFQAWELGAR